MLPLAPEYWRISRNTDDYNDFLQMSIEIAHYHHENWDGSGYPCGLKEDEIPLSAQIVAVAGAYCAPYGKPFLSRFF